MCVRVCVCVRVHRWHVCVCVCKRHVCSWVACVCAVGMCVCVCVPAVPRYRVCVWEGGAAVFAPSHRRLLQVTVRELDPGFERADKIGGCASVC